MTESYLFRLGIGVERYHFNVVLHITADPHGCDRDMYIFMRPEMVNDKVCFVWVLLLQWHLLLYGSCYTAHALMLYGLCQPVLTTYTEKIVLWLAQDSTFWFLPLPPNYMNREASTLHHMSTVDTSAGSGWIATCSCMCMYVCSMCLSKNTWHTIKLLNTEYKSFGFKSNSRHLLPNILHQKNIPFTNKEAKATSPDGVSTGDVSRQF